jgi:phosphatidyl-myo-inositol dimannoside synthase
MFTSSAAWSPSGLCGDVEGYGIAAIEAALCGLPAVVTAGSGLAEAIRDRETGLLVPQEDEDATAAAVLRLWRDPSLLRTMGEKARVRAASEQTWSRVASRYDERLREICGISESRSAAPPTRKIGIVRDPR